MKKIMIVDDEKDICYIFQTFLKIKGYDVEVSYNSTDALNKVKAKRPDIIFLDLILPDFDGVELASRIRTGENLKNLKIYLFTVRKRGLIEGEKKLFNGTVQKPFDFNHILSILERN
ncbi:MAG: hypothetical protein A2044_03255 [Candidatus Firestonebacteria bacterium GWA2_43_8]|nr:MAG: hypothetical protein A2044_03255 [Candidatus Firestonebacteria bacterium GWA2_43_8]